MLFVLIYVLFAFLYFYLLNKHSKNLNYKLPFSQKIIESSLFPFVLGLSAIIILTIFVLNKIKRKH